MICQDCQERPATLHFTKIINGEKTEIQLCEKCAHEKGEMFMFSTGSGFSINNLLSGLLNIDEKYTDPKETAFKQKKVLQCDRCSMTLHQFTKIGRFGCAHCYEVFQEHLKPILRRLHSGNWSHNGKIPTRIGEHMHVRKELGSLKQQLKELIAREEFEDAAHIRDEIRGLEKGLLENSEREG